MARADRADGVTVVNDAYNANPEPMAAALRTLAQPAAPLTRRPVSRTAPAVLGAMLELGDSLEEHDRIGRLCGACMNISKLIAVVTRRSPSTMRLTWKVLGVTKQPG